MLTEKINLINEYKTLQKENEKLKTENSNTLPKKVNAKNSNIVNNYNSNNHSNDAEIIRLKNEIQNLKLQNLQKEEIIKNLKEEKEENEKDKGEDLEFYKKSYEEQKFRVNEEHKLISESLYKLAVHFMSLKDDLQKKINNNNNNK
jgi:translation initiation factor 2 beta subunit (eIF-2beta)/eIF-5